MGLVYEPEFTREMMDELACADQPELFALVGFGPRSDEAAHSLATFGWPALCRAMNVDPDVAEETHAMLTGARDDD